MIQINEQFQDDAKITPAEDLHEIMNAYNLLTQRLQHSHEQLGDEVVRLRRQLASQEGQLARSRRLAAVGEMAAGIAHEIRNPLAALQLYTKMLGEDLSQLTGENDGAKARSLDIIGKMSGAIKGLNEIVGDVLTFSKEINPRYQHISLDQLFLKVLSLYDPQIEDADIEVQITGDAVTLDVDPLLLQQAMGNLVRNSVDALRSQDSAKTNLKLTMDARVQDDCVCIQLRDNGPGVDETIVDRIFNPFFTTRASGTGLGLAIVHRIAEAHQGTISVYNDGGAVFEMLLPLNQTLEWDESQQLKINQEEDRPASKAA